MHWSVYRLTTVHRLLLPEAIVETLTNLSEYVAQHNLPYTVATTLQITPDIAERTIQTVFD